MISVVIATYNGEKYIEEQLVSIIKQSLKPDELVLVDDSSADKTLIIAENILQDSDIEYVIIKHKYNEGVCNTFYDGIEKANGDVIFLSDQDDYWCTDKVETMMRKIHEGYEVVMSNAKVVNEDLSNEKGDLWGSLDFSPVENRRILLSEMLKRNYFTGMNMCFKKSVLKPYKRPRNMLHDEFLGWIALSKGDVGFVCKELAFYRQHENNVVGVGKRNKICGLRKTKEIIKGNIRKEIKKLLYIKKIFEQTNEEYLEIKDAMRFYCWRYACVGQRNICAFYAIIAAVYNGRYRKYTSKNEKAILKDFFCSILK